ncbi:hypothetical protein GCM10023149_28430 [Mucilaginibacter gynuensis]|uniref:Mobilization protein MobC n=1 Tax=Mucilaginibacter gynuensis TaxID=1302236 RepID=A0ABP8GKU4_9SPHI
MTKQKKSMGRPKLTGNKRNNFINVRFTDEEYLQIIELEKVLDLSRTDLIRLRVLSDAGRVVINARELMSRMDTIGADMGRIGNNINQLAKHANTLKLQNALDPLVVRKFNALFEEYIGIQQLLETALRKIIRELGR